MSLMNHNSLRAFWVILRKELLDNFRDKRTLNTMAFSIVIGPVLLFAFLWFAEKTVKEETDPINATAVQLPVKGGEHALNLMAWLEQNNVEILPPPDDPIAVLKNKKYQMIHIIESNFSDAFESGRTAPLKLMHDSSVSGFEKIGYQRVRSAINAYSSQIGRMRLTARGVNPEIAMPIKINTSDVASSKSQGAQLVTMLPYLIIIFVMVGGMYLAIDTTAGEREKGSLESLLVQPVSRSRILSAKLAATIVFSGVTFFLVLVGLALGFKYMSLELLSLSVGVSTVIKIFISCFPFVFVGCALMVLIASFTKSYKEAQSYLGMIMAVPTMPLIMLTFISPVPSLNNMWLPSLSQALIIIETIKGEVVPLHLILYSMLSSTLIAIALTYVAIKLYQRERILG